ncbi:MAG: beta-ketoacyl synthase chain length factor, partial [Steroidobacteraceae bacterium]
MLAACVQGVGVLGPGLPGWDAAAAVLRASRSYQRTGTVIPALAVLQPAERRRAGRVVRMALTIGAEAIVHAGADASRLPSVFASSGGDGDNCHEICEALAGSERLISPTRFHNSVHNAASGYWSIA